MQVGDPGYNVTVSGGGGHYNATQSAGASGGHYNPGPDEKEGHNTTTWGGYGPPALSLSPPPPLTQPRSEAID
jgi:hypothetical protein